MQCFVSLAVTDSHLVVWLFIVYITKTHEALAALLTPQAHSAPLYMHFLVKSWIICASAVTATHTHTHHLLQNSLRLHLILNCTWDVVTTCISVTVFFPLSEMRTYQLACCTTAHRMHPQRFWWQQRFLTTPIAVSQSTLPEHSHTATSLPLLAEYKPLQDCCGDGCGLAATDRNKIH